MSIPGRLDGQQDDAMRKGDMNPKTKSSVTQERIKDARYNLNRSRTLVNPSGCKKILIYNNMVYVNIECIASHSTVSSLFNI